MEKRLMDVKEAAEYLGMTEGALYKKVWKRQVPFAVKIGRSLRFDTVRMDEWIEENCLKVEKPTSPSTDLTLGGVCSRVGG